MIQIHPSSSKSSNITSCPDLKVTVTTSSSMEDTSSTTSGSTTPTGSTLSLDLVDNLMERCSIRNYFSRDSTGHSSGDSGGGGCLSTAGGLMAPLSPRRYQNKLVLPLG